MQLFDSLTLLVLLVILVSLYLPVAKRTSWLRVLPLLALVPGLIHLFAEGFRWQMGYMCLGSDAVKYRPDTSMAPRPKVVSAATG
jgi:hypothetical protein